MIVKTSGAAAVSANNLVHAEGPWRRRPGKVERMVVVVFAELPPGRNGHWDYNAGPALVEAEFDHNVVGNQRKD